MITVITTANYTLQSPSDKNLSMLQTIYYQQLIISHDWLLRPNIAWNEQKQKNRTWKYLKFQPLISWDLVIDIVALGNYLKVIVYLWYLYKSKCHQINGLIFFSNCIGGTDQVNLSFLNTSLPLTSNYREEQKLSWLEDLSNNPLNV